MKIKDMSWSIVLAGKWNRFIISPEWAAKNIFKEEKIKVEMAIGLGAPPRFSSSEIMMIPSEDRVAFHLLDHSDECLQKAEELAVSLLTILNHTPVNALGVNFGFIEAAPNDDLMELFAFEDNDSFIEQGYSIKDTNIIRKLEIEPESSLNLTMGAIEAGLGFDFNFHYEVNSTKEAADILKGKLLSNKEVALNLLQANYKLRLED
ncbi:MAG: hypothetical protein BA869_04945 [Desulfuromonadales bacterium C00003107]|jgi:hypothetical protein|nr:MAG: hypothetical protein BA869_04945 [Desulfuromonadales bacterium C00003107]